MFLGEFQHSLDVKGRVILPAEFRAQLAEGAVIGAFKGGCLAVYTAEEFARVSDEVREMSKAGDTELDAARAFFADARMLTPDRQGRIPIPTALREYAGLERDVVLTGANSRIEVWDAARWRAKKAEGRAALAGAGLAGFGI
jgi:MraZ protein